VSFVIDSEIPADTPCVWLIWEGAQLLRINGQLPDSAQGLQLTNRKKIGLVHGTGCFSGQLIGPAPLGAEWVGMRQVMNVVDRSWQQAISRARQVNLFEHEHRFCGSCAAPLQTNRHDSGKHCPSCSALYYPRLSPAMMVTIVRGREILLAHAPHFLDGVYSALAGFVEPGETLEQCVHREVREEVSLEVKNLRYASSQSWPFPHSLMLAFVADYESGDIVPQEGEIADAQWFDIDHLPLLPSSASIAWWLIQHTVRQIKEIPPA
jgi:NAD+ diphosphatase